MTIESGARRVGLMRWGMPGPVFPPSKPGGEPPRPSFITNVRNTTSRHWTPCRIPPAIGWSPPQRPSLANRNLRDPGRAHPEPARDRRYRYLPVGVGSAQPVELWAGRFGGAVFVARGHQGNSRCSRPSSVAPARLLPTRRTVAPSGKVKCGPAPSTSLTETHAPFCL